MPLQNLDQAIKDFTKRKPFQTFFVELKSGRIIQVDHPEAMIARNGQAAWIGTGGDIAIFDADGVARVFSGRSEATEKAG